MFTAVKPHVYQILIMALQENPKFAGKFDNDGDGDDDDDNDDNDDDVSLYLYHNRVHSRVKLICHHMVLLVHLGGSSILFVSYFVVAIDIVLFLVLCHYGYHHHHHGYHDHPDQQLGEVDEAKDTKPPLPSTSTDPPATNRSRHMSTCIMNEIIKILESPQCSF